MGGEEEGILDQQAILQIRRIPTTQITINKVKQNNDSHLPFTPITVSMGILGQAGGKDG